MSKEKPAPPASLMPGMDVEERRKFVESWNNVGWLTDPVRKTLEQKRKKLLAELLYPEIGASSLENQLLFSPTNDTDIKAEIRAIDFFLRMIP